MARRALFASSLEKDTSQRSTDHTEGRAFFNYYIENRETQKNLKKKPLFLAKKWYHVGISKDFPLILVVSCWYFKDTRSNEIDLNASISFLFN